MSALYYYLMHVRGPQSLCMYPMIMLMTEMQAKIHHAQIRIGVIQFF